MRASRVHQTCTEELKSADITIQVLFLRKPRNDNQLPTSHPHGGSRNEGVRLLRSESQTPEGHPSSLHHPYMGKEKHIFLKPIYRPIIMFICHPRNNKK